jgi:riboflavin transporter FmnP
LDSEFLKTKIFLRKGEKTMSQTAATAKTKSNQWSARLVAGTAMLSALAFVLQYFEIALPIMPGFIKFDFSDLPALLGAFAYGPVAGILIEFIKNLIHCAVSQSATVGELSNFILGAVFAGTAGFIYKFHKTKKMALIGAVVGSLAMGLISFPSNYFVVYPFYYNFMAEEAVLSMYQLILPSMKSVPECLVVFNIPFTIAKGLISTVIVMLIYKPLSTILKGRQ